MPRLEIEFSMLNDEGTNQFSYEDTGLMELHIALMLVFAAIFGGTVYSYVLYYQDFQRMDSPHFVLILALFLQLSGLMLEFFHLMVYSWNGKGIPVFDIFSLISHMLAEISITCLLIMLA